MHLIQKRMQINGCATGAFHPTNSVITRANDTAGNSAVRVQYTIDIYLIGARLMVTSQHHMLPTASVNPGIGFSAVIITYRHTDTTRGIKPAPKNIVGASVLLHPGH